MSKIKNVFKNAKVITLLVFIIFAIVSISPNPGATGVSIRNIVSNSSANLAGLENPKPGITAMARERIVEMNNVPIITTEDYYSFMENVQPNRTIQIKTNRGSYMLKTREMVHAIELNETIKKEITQEVFDEELNKTINKTDIIDVPKIELNYTGILEDIGIRVQQAPKTNIKKGLDLQGGTRILLQPEEKLEEYDLDTLIDNMKERLNVYGLSDVIIREAGDLSGNQYILVEIAGATEDEVKDLLAKQGKFEAKVGNTTVFKGGQDITYVCRSADCAGIDPYSGCGQSGSEHFCRFRFSITLTQDAAKRQAEATKDLEVVSENSQQYLSEKLYLYLDDALVDELNIGSDLKGQAATDIQISGSGVGLSQQEAALTSLNNMKRLQTILITGSLPVKLNIVKMDTISPVLGSEFVRNAIMIGIIAVLVVALVVFLRYRKIQVVLPIIFTLASEVVILLGFGALVRWNIDLAAIAGIIIAVGTGVDHLIIISDETLRKESSQIYDWKKRIKNAFFMIMAAFLTTAAAMVPLLFAGAGLLKGFALTTLAGMIIGVLIARPAYGAMIEILLKD